jgi:hypothetical protein
MKDKIGKCKICGLGFTQKDYDNASNGVVGDECLVGDYDDICYPCQLKEVRMKIGKDLKDFYTDEHLIGSAEGHLSGWFKTQYQGKSKEDCMFNLRTNHDNSLEIEHVEEALKRKLTPEEQDYVVEKFHKAVIKQIDFEGASGWYDTCGDRND